jgi:uncharacterized membrane protein YoaK (UPF0700 family)
MGLTIRMTFGVAWHSNLLQSVCLSDTWGATVNWQQNWPGWLLCFVCGVMDATNFIALGGTFVGLMTGNLLLMGVGLGDTGITGASLVFLLPLAGYSVGALVAGSMSAALMHRTTLIDILWTSWVLLFVVTLLVWSSDPVGVKVIGWIVVIGTALYMGFQSGALHVARKGHMTTNVMTSTLTTFLADAPAQMLAHHVAWHKAVAVVSFLVGAWVGSGVLGQFGIGASYGLALLTCLVAIIGESQQIKHQLPPEN